MADEWKKVDIGDLEKRLAELETQFKRLRVDPSTVAAFSQGDCTNGCTDACTRGCTNGCTGANCFKDLTLKDAGINPAIANSPLGR